MRGAPASRRQGGVRRGIIPAYAGSTFAKVSASWYPRDHPRVCGEHMGARPDNLSNVGSSPRMRGARLARRLEELPRGIIPAYAGSTLVNIKFFDSIWDHPRVCGEHKMSKYLNPTTLGSSPRMRGAQPDKRDWLIAFGIIPAYAGSTSRPRPSTGTTRDHPRVCGEHRGLTIIGKSAQGSSPRMRGALPRHVPANSWGGIIPAYAGSTTCRWQMRLTCRDHPRVCGEHGRFPHAARGRRGSSPRMRGAHALDWSFGFDLGIIPAYAGSTDLIDPEGEDDEDHPRVCGEHRVDARRRFDLSGSSPRMRGAQVARRAHLLAHGIIPAYAGSTGPAASGRSCARDHPRVCGEHRPRGYGSRRLPGSSPRMRGAPLTSRQVFSNLGIIPAYAGSTWSARASLGKSWDHPRVCGEHRGSSMSAPRRRGSSPRMRGAPPLPRHSHCGAGIIPAYAGSTRGHAGPARDAADHPRVCGEHRALLYLPAHFSGSSPRMRGARLGDWLAASVPGIIPAYAGSTRTRTRSGPCRRDHPRVCGEHSVGSPTRYSRPGSSPRMRGARRAGGRRLLPLRIIPAYAGSTTRSISTALTARDHPRVCGEHQNAALECDAGKGSSPRMRGAPVDSLHACLPHGIIPAYAGSTIPRTTCSCRNQDHPRVCGEHFSFTTSSAAIAGSSPRMRGAHLHAGQLLRKEGIIPAYAGSTKTYERCQ